MFVSSGVFEWAGRMLFYFGLTLRDLGLSDQAAVLLTAVILPLLTAAAVFICLRRASLARKFSVYFISMLIYVLLTVFIFSDIKGFAASLGADTSGISDGFLDLTGLHAATSVGIVFFGFNTLFCSSGITKPRGRLALLVLTLFFFILDLVFFITLLKPDLNGYESVVAFSFTGKSRTGSFEIGFGIISFLTLFLYIACGFLCFTANKTAAEISEDNRRMFSALSYQKSTVNGVEKNCSNCQYGRKLSDEDKILCPKLGVTRSDQICGSYLYDPLKRLPPKTNNSDLHVGYNDKIEFITQDDNEKEDPS